MLEIGVAIVEGIVAICAAIIDLVASLFVAAGETLGAIDLILVLIVFLIELLFWVFLLSKEVLFSIVQWRKPRFIKKPIIWRPKAKKKKAKNTANKKM